MCFSLEAQLTGCASLGCRKEKRGERRGQAGDWRRGGRGTWRWKPGGAKDGGRRERWEKRRQERPGRLGAWGEREERGWRSLCVPFRSHWKTLICSWRPLSQGSSFRKKPRPKTEATASSSCSRLPVSREPCGPRKGHLHPSLGKSPERSRLSQESPQPGQN